MMDVAPHIGYINKRTLPEKTTTLHYTTLHYTTLHYTTPPPLQKHNAHILSFVISYEVSSHTVSFIVE